jgi:hypothetical protein
MRRIGTGIVPALNSALPPGTSPAVPVGFGSTGGRSAMR